MSSNQNQREMAMALAPQPPIFKLDVDCFEELFGWLSLEDLHAIGQTCTRMQKVAGYYFRLTYPGAKVYLHEYGIFCDIYYRKIRINRFVDFIENVKLDSNHKNTQNFLVGRLNNFKSLHFDFRHGTFYGESFAQIKNVLSRAETIEVKRYSDDALYDLLLKHCTNMKRLCVKYCDDNYEWLLQHYPQLEQLVLDPYEGDQEIVELTTFFERNRSMQHFATDDKCLVASQDSITASNVQFDTLSINWDTELDTLNDELGTLLNDFHERKVYKRLHLYVGWAMEDDIHRVISPTVQSVIEKVAYKCMPTNVLSMPFINLKELDCGIVHDWVDMEIAARTLVNLELVRFSEAKANHIFAFIRRSRKLAHIGVKLWPEDESCILDLTSWDKERGQLDGARKVAIWIDEYVFLQTKKATLNKNYELIEINRYESRRWILDFYEHEKCMLFMGYYRYK